MTKFDLKKRTFDFSKEVIYLCNRIPKSRINDPLVSQLVRSATSIGANYMEADSGSSKKYFINKLTIARKEINETKYWINLFEETLPEEKQNLQRLYKEADELNSIFSVIIKKSKETLVIRH